LEHLVAVYLIHVFFERVYVIVDIRPREESKRGYSVAHVSLTIHGWVGVGRSTLLLFITGVACLILEQRFATLVDLTGIIVVFVSSHHT
jgi:50S ribosomal subunit-associated GTPase HflX